MARKPIIRSTLDAIGAQYTPEVRSWLAEKNPMALRQLDAFPDKVDAVALDITDEDRLLRICKVWEQTWLFWIANYRRTNAL